MNSLCFKGRIAGKVQGVGFRQSTVVQARQLGLAGWVRNLDDGSVEILFAGDRHAVEALRDWLRIGPPGARVDELWLEPCDAHPSGSFERR